MYKKFGAFYKIDTNSLPQKANFQAGEDNAEVRAEIATENDIGETAVDYSPYRDYLTRHRRLSAEIARRSKV